MTWVRELCFVFCVCLHIYIPATGVEPQVIVAHESALPAAGDHEMDENQVLGTQGGHRICASVRQAAEVSEY